MRRYADDEGNQIVMCGRFAYIWPDYYPPLKVGEAVLVSPSPLDRGGLRTVTDIGTDLGGAVGWVRGRAGLTR